MPLKSSKPKGGKMKEFTNRVAVVTGAASGIGRAMSKRFLEILPPPEGFMEIYQELMSQSGGQSL
jgi:hypothetical protein